MGVWEKILFYVVRSDCHVQTDVLRGAASDCLLLIGNKVLRSSIVFAVIVPSS